MNESLSDAAFREALSRFATGVTVVTARTPSGPVGFTASAFTSVSLAPRLVLVCVAKRASAHDAIVAAAAFGVNILIEEQLWVAEQFARSGVDRFERVALRGDGSHGVPLLEGALATVECVHYGATEAGDHTILVGEVVNASVTGGRPLVHYARRFGSFAAESGMRVPSTSDRAWKAGEA
jgi:flavin reductase (DIM6/NTAB) family NADH-FMN oxidoreductase RutF